MAQHALFVGDASWDTTILAGRLPDADEKVVVPELSDGPGGVVANAAMAYVRSGAPAAICLAVGDDVAGTEIVTGLQRTGLAVKAERLQGRSSRAVTVLDDSCGGEKRLFLYPGTAMYPSASVIRALDLSSAGWAHTALYDLTAGLELTDRCRQENLPFSVDLEPATIPSDVQTLAPALRGCAAVMVNTRAVQKLGPDAVAWLSDLVAGAVVETRGAEGVRVTTPTGVRVLDAPRLTAPPVDTTGAGDAFAGWYIAEMMVGSDPGAAAEIAVAAATYSVRSLGTYQSYPDRTELTDFITDQHNRKATS